jgi:hypothetical protein
MEDAKLFPAAGASEELETDGEGIDPKSVTIDDAGPGAEITSEGVDVQAIIKLPGLVRNDAGTVGAYVFRNALVSAVAKIEAAEIHSYREGKTWFKSRCNGLHGTPPLASVIPMGLVSGWERRTNYTPTGRVTVLGNDEVAPGKSAQANGTASTNIESQNRELQTLAGSQCWRTSCEFGKTSPNCSPIPRFAWAYMTVAGASKTCVSVRIFKRTDVPPIRGLMVST